MNKKSCPNCGATQPHLKIFHSGYQCTICGAEEYGLDMEDRSPQ